MDAYGAEWDMPPLLKYLRRSAFIGGSNAVLFSVSAVVVTLNDPGRPGGGPRESLATGKAFAYTFPGSRFGRPTGLPSCPVA